MTIKRAAKKFLTGVKTKRTPTGVNPAVKVLDRGEIEDLIREQAYKLYEQRGYAHGQDVNDWIEAERIITKA